MKISRNLIYGLGIIAAAAFLYTQTLQGGKVLFEGDIDPMIYPRIILLILGCMGAIVAIQGLLNPGPKIAVSIFTFRTITVSLIFICYAAVFKYVGFVITSFLGGCAIALTMGWRKPLVLILTMCAATAAIWLLFNKALHILLPTGILF